MADGRFKLAKDLTNVLCKVRDLSRDLFLVVVRACPSVADALDEAINEQFLTRPEILLMIECAELHGLGSRCSETGALVSMSYNLWDYWLLHDLADITRAGASTMFNYTAAQRCLEEEEEADGPARARVLQAWHHDEALDAGLLELSLLKFRH